MKEWLARLKEKPWVAHLLRAVERFGNRLGSAFGAAITYFSVLALVPILLLSFSIAGFVLTVARPDLLNGVATAAADALGGTDAATQQKILDVAKGALSNWKGVGIVGLLSAIYSGAGWMGNLKNAVRAQWRPDFDLQEAQGNIVKKTLVNLVTLLGLVVLIAITFGLASLATGLTDNVLDWLHLSDVGWLGPVLHIVPIVFSIGAGWLLFMFLYTVLPEDREPWPIVRRGALIGAVGLAVLQYATGLLFTAFQSNKAAQLFGPVIVLMLFFNLFAQLILFVAAWIATARHEAISGAQEKVRFPLTPEGGVDKQAAGDDGIVGDPATGEPVLVPQHVAVRSARATLGAGYVTGAATGLGIGAGLAWLTSRAVRGRR